MTAKVILEAADIVGESIVYDDRREALLWVDIVGKRIHRLSLSDHRHELWRAPDFPGEITVRKPDSFSKQLSQARAIVAHSRELAVTGSSLRLVDKPALLIVGVRAVVIAFILEPESRA
jgi:sugar lactone lactonase YvrE